MNKALFIIALTLAAIVIALAIFAVCAVLPVPPHVHIQLPTL